ncbi:MAG: glycerophosphodiester phosphodiesterase [Thermoprotei archaeon]|nr:MAG: glycerophosphodiester phosphodiesterase [Thermoprotei archaeon]
MNLLLIFAHRGCSTQAPENTLSAFRRAFEIGADGVELDVRQTKDGHLVVIHDPKVDRTTNGKGFVEERTLDELKKLVIDGYEHIPTLRETLKLASDYGKMLLIDLKTVDVEDKLVEEIKEYGMTEKVIVTNQFFYCSKRIKEKEPKIKTALLLFKGLNYEDEDPIELAKEFKADYIHPAKLEDVTEELVARAHENGIGVIAGTTDDPLEAEYLYKIGVDAVTPNRPEIFIKIAKKFTK